MSMQINAVGTVLNNADSNQTTAKSTTEDFQTMLPGKLNEDDQMMYDELKNAGVDLVKNPLSWQKQHVKSLAFPPFTAPASVKKAWIAQMNQLPADQKKQIQHDSSTLWLHALRSNQSLETDVHQTGFSYDAFMTELIHTAGKLSQTLSNAGSTVSFLSEFQKTLKA